MHHGLPSTSLTLVFSFDRPIDFGWLRGPGTRGRHWAVACGLQLAAPRGWAARFAALDRSLLGLAPARSDSWLSGDQTLRRAWRQLHTTRGTQPVAQLAAEAGWIRSQLGRLAGLPPTGWLAAERPCHEAG